MKTYLKAVLFAAIILVVSACYYDSQEDLYPVLNTECNLDNVTFSGDITQILQNRCWSCHSNANAATFGNNIRLQDYSDVSAGFDVILGAVNHQGGFSPMPKNGGKLSSCELNTLAQWNTDGKPEN